MMIRFAACVLLICTLCTAAPYEVVEDTCTLKVLTPALADRASRKIRLSNQLEAYLVSDPGASQSCAALAIEAGSWQDPEEYPGMAHFLEHMLFMGTAAYPEEAEYKKFISDHGGLWNAYTASDRTVYGLSIDHGFIQEALDRFAHFFIDPLFLQHRVGRELKAVGQEHAKNLESDAWRTYMVLKETGNPHHPNSKFSTGNERTLAGIPRHALQSWYEEHYSANRMHLMVISTLPIDQLVDTVVKCFSSVPNRNLPAPDYPLDLLSPQQQGHWLYVQPVKHLKTVSLIWQLPTEVASDPGFHAVDLVNYVMSNGTHNSILEALKRENLAEKLSIGPHRLSHTCALLHVDIELTEQGMRQPETVVRMFFEGLNQLKMMGMPRFIVDEHQKMALAKYTYQSREDPFNKALEVASQLVDEPLESYPERWVTVPNYDALPLASLLEALRPDRCVYVASLDPRIMLKGEFAQEQWMGTQYGCASISEEVLTSWGATPPNPRIGLPSPNPYLPTALKLISPSISKEIPECIASDSWGIAYHAQDHHYWVPEACVMLNIKTPLLDGSAQARALFDLYSRVFMDQLRESIFFASQAGLNCAVSVDGYDYCLKISGYSEKIDVFVSTLVQAMPGVLPTAQAFDMHKASLLACYGNASKELPLRQSVQVLNSMLLNCAPTPSAKREALESVTYAHFLQFAHQAFETTFLEGTFYGNLAVQEARNLWARCKEGLGSRPFPPEMHDRKRVHVPSKARGPFMMTQVTERQGNSALLLLYEDVFSMRTRAIQQILSAALRDDFFDTLRSRQQTGYIAMSWDLEEQRQLFQLFGVQSITHQPGELLARFDLFLEDFIHDLHHKISPTRFETLRRTLVSALEKLPENLEKKTAELHYLAFEKKGDFSWLQKRITAAEHLTYNDFATTVNRYLARSNKQRFAILTTGVLPEQHQFSYRPVSPEETVFD